MASWVDAPVDGSDIPGVVHAPLRIIVVGEPRSGTTLTTSLIAAQEGFVRLIPGFQGGFETLHTLGTGAFDELSERQRFVLRAHMVRTAGILEDGQSTSSFADWHRSSCRAAAGRARAVADRVHRPLSAVAPLLREPDVRVVVVHRDPRDVMLSRAFQYAHEQTEGSIIAWRRAVAHARKLRGHPRFLELRFEDLVSETDRVTAALGRLWGGTCEASRLRSGGNGGRAFVENSTFGDVKGLFDPVAVERWRTRPSDVRVRLSGWTCRRELEELGYPKPEPLTDRERVRFAGRWAAALSISHASRLRRRLSTVLLPPLER